MDFTILPLTPGSLVRLNGGTSSGLPDPPMGTVEHRQAIPITGHGLAVNQARRSLERERGARDQGEAAQISLGPDKELLLGKLRVALVHVRENRAS